MIYYSKMLRYTHPCIKIYKDKSSICWLYYSLLISIALAYIIEIRWNLLEASTPKS